MSTLSTWSMALFFLLYGLAAFVPALNTDMIKKIVAVFAVIVGLVSIFGLLGVK